MLSYHMVISYDSFQVAKMISVITLIVTKCGFVHVASLHAGLGKILTFVGAFDRTSSWLNVIDVYFTH